jgi:hypothetical protein
MIQQRTHIPGITFTTLFQAQQDGRIFGASFNTPAQSDLRKVEDGTSVLIPDVSAEIESGLVNVQVRTGDMDYTYPGGVDPDIYNGDGLYLYTYCNIDGTTIEGTTLTNVSVFERMLLLRDPRILLTRQVSPDANNTSTVFLHYSGTQIADGKFVDNYLHYAPTNEVRRILTCTVTDAILKIARFTLDKPLSVVPANYKLVNILSGVASDFVPTGVGPYSVTITVNKPDDTPLAGASVKLEDAMGYIVVTASDGEAAFSLNAGVYTLSITKDGYFFEPVTITVPATLTYTATMDANAVSPTPSPGQATGSITTYDQIGVVQVGARIQFVLVGLITPTPGTSFDRSYFVGTSGIAGLLTQDFLASARYRGRRETASTNVWGPWVDITTPASGTFTLPEILGRQNG